MSAKTALPSDSVIDRTDTSYFLNTADRVESHFTAGGLAQFKTFNGTSLTVLPNPPAQNFQSAGSVQYNLGKTEHALAMIDRFVQKPKTAPLYVELVTPAGQHLYVVKTHVLKAALGQEAIAAESSQPVNGNGASNGAVPAGSEKPQEFTVETLAAGLSRTFAATAKSQAGKFTLLGKTFALAIEPREINFPGLKTMTSQEVVVTGHKLDNASLEQALKDMKPGEYISAKPPREHIGLNNSAIIMLGTDFQKAKTAPVISLVGVGPQSNRFAEPLGTVTLQSGSTRGTATPPPAPVVAPPVTVENPYILAQKLTEMMKAGGQGRRQIHMRDKTYIALSTPGRLPEAEGLSREYHGVPTANKLSDWLEGEVDDDDRKVTRGALEEIAPGEHLIIMAHTDSKVIKVVLLDPADEVALMAKVEEGLKKQPKSQPADAGSAVPKPYL